MDPNNPIERKERPIVVAAICGSLRAGSATRQALRIALHGAKEMGAETRLIDLRDYELAFCGEMAESGYPEDVFRLRRDVAQAQGILLGTPEYHGGYSGLLKNALDLMGSEEFQGKMIGLVGVSPGLLDFSSSSFCWPLVSAFCISSSETSPKKLRTLPRNPPSPAPRSVSTFLTISSL